MIAHKAIEDIRKEGTRVIEHKHLAGREDAKGTVISREYRYYDMDEVIIRAMKAAGGLLRTGR